MDFFYNSICHTCKEPKKDLKRCGSCKFIAYCSKEHQITDWKNHKQICKFLVESAKFVKLEIGCSYERWRSYRTYLQFFLEQRLQRPLLPYESQIWMFPRHCAVCYSTEKLEDCPECFCVAYCSIDHRTVNENIHRNFCSDLKLCLQLDCFYSKPPTIEIVLREIKQCIETMPASMQEMTEIFLDTSKYRDTLERLYVTDKFAYMLTILYALESCKIIQNREVINGELVIHLVGADIHELSADWENNAKLLKAWIKNLRSCKMILIGPDFDLSNSDEIYSSDVLKVECYNDLYHNVVEKIDVPNMIVALNSGIHEFESKEVDDTWNKSLSKLVSTVPLALTAYTTEELFEDLKRLEVFNVKRILNVTRNPFSNLRPIRDWDSKDNEPFFVNGFIAIIVVNNEFT